MQKPAQSHHNMGESLQNAPNVGRLYFLTGSALSSNIQIENNITVESAMFTKKMNCQEVASEARSPPL